MQQPSPRMIHNMQTAQGLAGWAGFLAGLWLMGSLAWANFTDGSTVGGVVLAVLTLPVAFGLMRAAVNMSHYPIAAVCAVVMLFRRTS